MNKYSNNNNSSRKSSIPEVTWLAAEQKLRFSLEDFHRCKLQWCGCTRQKPQQRYPTEVQKEACIQCVSCDNLIVQVARVYAPSYTSFFHSCNLFPMFIYMDIRELSRGVYFLQHLVNLNQIELGFGTVTDALVVQILSRKSLKPSGDIAFSHS